MLKVMDLKGQNQNFWEGQKLMLQTRIQTEVQAVYAWICLDVASIIVWSIYSCGVASWHWCPVNEPGTKHFHPGVQSLFRPGHKSIVTCSVLVGLKTFPAFDCQASVELARAHASKAPQVLVLKIAATVLSLDP